MNEHQEEAFELWKQKKVEFERELAITSNPSLKFELRQRIRECEQELKRLSNTHKAENDPPNVFDKKFEPIDLEQKTKNLDISPDEWFSKRRPNQSLVGKFFKSIFEDS